MQCREGGWEEISDSSIVHDFGPGEGFQFFTSFKQPSSTKHSSEIREFSLTFDA